MDSTYVPAKSAISVEGAHAVIVALSTMTATVDICIRGPEPQTEFGAACTSGLDVLSPRFIVAGAVDTRLIGLTTVAQLRRIPTEPPWAQPAAAN